MKTLIGFLMIATLLAVGTTALADDDVKVKKAKPKPEAVRKLEAEIKALTVRIDRLKAEKELTEATAALDQLEVAKRKLEAARLWYVAPKDGAWVSHDGGKSFVEWEKLKARSDEMQRDLDAKKLRLVDAENMIDYARARIKDLEKRYTDEHPQLAKAKDELRSAERLATDLRVQVNQATEALKRHDWITVGKELIALPRVTVDLLGAADAVKPGFKYEVKRGKAERGDPRDPWWTDYTYKSRIRRFEFGQAEQRELRKAIDVLRRNGMHEQAAAAQKRLAEMEAQRERDAHGEGGVLAELRALRADVRALREDVASLKALVKELR